MATLYELKEQYLTLLNMMVDAEEDEAVFNDTMEGLTGEISEKIEAYKIIDLELEAEEEKLGREISRLSTAKAKIIRNRERLKNAIVGMLQELPEQKLDTEHFKFKMVNNGGIAPLIFDKSREVPEEYYKYVREIDNSKIRECLKHGELDFVRLGERGKRLSIK